jgi:hypothetical protein
MGIRSLGASGKIFNDIRAESGFIDHIPNFEPGPSIYPELSAFNDSTDGRYDARIFISGNDGNILDWQTGPKVSRSIDYSGDLTTGNSDVATGAPGAQKSLAMTNAWVGADTAWKNTGAISFALWIKKADSSECHIMHTQNQGDMPIVSNGVSLRMHPSSGNYADWNPTTGGNQSMSNGAWRHIIFVQNGSNDRYWFVDGVQRQQNANQNSSYDSAGWSGSGNEVTFFGSRGSSYNRGQFNGNAYGIRVFDFAISQSQATALYNAKV